MWGSTSRPTASSDGGTHEVSDAWTKDGKYFVGGMNQGNGRASGTLEYHKDTFLLSYTGKKPTWSAEWEVKDGRLTLEGKMGPVPPEALDMLAGVASRLSGCTELTIAVTV